MKNPEHLHKSEADLTQSILDDAKKRTGWSLDKIGGGWGKGGKADIIGPYKGFFVSLEIKKPDETNKPSPLQKKWGRDKINKWSHNFLVRTVSLHA